LRPDAGAPISKIGSTGRYFKNFVRFLDAYRWLAVYHLKPNWILVLSVAALSFLSAVSQALTIGFVAYTLDFIQSPRSLGIGFIDSILDNPKSSLLLFGILLALISVGGTWSRYRAALFCRRVGRLFHERVLSESVSRVNSLNAIPASLGLLDEATLQRSIGRNGAILGRTTESLVRMIEPMLRLGVGVGILIYIDWRMGFVLIPLVMLMFPGLYAVNARLRRVSDVFYESSTPTMGRHVREIVQFINSQNVDQYGGRGHRIDESLKGDDTMTTYLDELDSMTLASQRVQFILNSINATALGLALVGAGYLASRGEIRWSEAMASLMALWQIQQASLQCGSNLSMLTRFYSFIVKTRKLMSIAPLPTVVSDETTLSALGDTPVFLSCEDGLSAGYHEMQLTPGDRVYLVTDTALDRLNFIRLLEPLSDASGRTAKEFVGMASFVSSRYRVFDENFEQATNAGPKKCVSTLLEDLGLKEEIRDLGITPKTRLEQRHWAQMSGPLRAALTLISATRSPCEILVCDGRLLHGLAPAVSDRLLDIFDDRILLIHHASNRLKRALTDRFIVVEQGLIRGMGDEQWFREISGDICFGAANASAELVHLENDDF